MASGGGDPEPRGARFELGGVELRTEGGVGRELGGGELGRVAPGGIESRFVIGSRCSESSTCCAISENPRIRSAVVPDAGHYIHDDQPALFHQLARDFLLPTH